MYLSVYAEAGRTNFLWSCDVCSIHHHNWLFQWSVAFKFKVGYNLIYSSFLLLCLCTFFVFYSGSKFAYFFLPCVHFLSTGLNLYCFVLLIFFAALLVFIVFLHWSSVHINIYLYSFFAPWHPWLKIAPEIACFFAGPQISCCMRVFCTVWICRW